MPKSGCLCCAHLRDEVRVAQLIAHMRPYLVSSPLPRPCLRIPAQRSRSAAEAEERMFVLPRFPAARLRRIEEESS